MKNYRTRPSINHTRQQWRSQAGRAPTDLGPAATLTSAPTSNPLPRQRPHVPHHAITLRRLPETPLRRARRPRTSTSRTLTTRTSRTVNRADVDHADIPYRQPHGRRPRKKGYRRSGIFMQPCNNQLAHEGRVVTATSLGLRRYNKEDDRIIITTL